jgi:hypothetical protein
MTRRSKWLVAASIFTLINLGGAPFAFAGGEMLHGATHVVLTVVGAFFVWRFASRREQVSAVEQTDERFDHLQQSVDAIALDVERIGEAQRYIAKLAKQRAESPPPKPNP